jgi:hypothetical protein
VSMTCHAPDERVKQETRPKNASMKYAERALMATRKLTWVQVAWRI